MACVKLTLLIFLIGFHCTTSGEKLDRLENLISNLSNKFGDFVAAVDKITHMLSRMEENSTLNDLILKCSEYVNARNEIGVNKIWAQIIKNHNKTQVILNQIIVDAYGGKRENILPLIRFITRTKKCSGFETLFHEMADYGHFYNGGEIFSLANSILNQCNYSLFEKLPMEVQWILTKNISLQNTFNKGFLYRKFGGRDNGLENHIATMKAKNATDFWRFVAADDYAETFVIKNRNTNLVASGSRRLYFANTASSRFAIEMNTNSELSLGVELESASGRKFYRLYVQRQKMRNTVDHYEVNLWTINPHDDYGKFIYWAVAEQDVLRKILRSDISKPKLLLAWKLIKYRTVVEVIILNLSEQ
ncbi:unnamed protein product [Allacma fusca]|uniref:Uncharacterized protein n=1 Tax=Allacma fusca TaxID=39272 RepID=A0A8J2KYH5_9HEXA|nr:unnamed protein product [Allacma fusca]